MASGQAPPEMLELHGLEAPEFVRPKHGEEADDYDDEDDDSANTGAPSKNSMDQTPSPPAIGTEIDDPGESSVQGMRMFYQLEEQAGASRSTHLSTLGGLDDGEESPTPLMGNNRRLSIGSRRPSQGPYAGSRTRSTSGNGTFRPPGRN